MRYDHCFRQSKQMLSGCIIGLVCLIGAGARAADTPSTQSVTNKVTPLADMMVETRNTTEANVSRDGRLDPVQGYPRFNPPNLTVAWEEKRGLVIVDRVTAIGTSAVRHEALRYMWGVTGNQEYGFSVASGVDIDSDGSDEIAVGAPGDANGTGMVSIVSGWTALPIRQIQGTVAGERFGESVALIRMPAPDNRVILVIGAPSYPAPDGSKGRVYGYNASTGALLWTYTNTASTQRFGVAVSARIVEHSSVGLLQVVTTQALRIGVVSEDPTGNTPRRLSTYLRDSSGPLASQPADPPGNPLSTLSEVLNNLGTAGPDGDLDNNALVDILDVELALQSLSQWRVADCNEFGLLHPSCRGTGLSACAQRLCRMLRDAVCRYAESVAINNVEMAAARETNAEELDYADFFYNLRI